MVECPKNWAEKRRTFRLARAWEGVPPTFSWALVGLAAMRYKKAVAIETIAVYWLNPRSKMEIFG
jgi:hypothetical protein